MHRAHALTFSLLASGCGSGAAGPLSPDGSTARSPDAGPDAGACALVMPEAASAQTRARVGAYYFDGWTGPDGRMHFDGLIRGPFLDRQPVTGWYDSDACVVEQQLAWARAFGVDFFIFDWYLDPARNADGEQLNSAFDITRRLADRHGMQYAILYANGGDFEVEAAGWPALVDEWVTYFLDPGYLRIGGKPLILILSPGALRNTFGGSSQGVAAAFDELRAAARARGLPGVFIANNTEGFASGSGGGEFPDFETLRSDGYDALSLYNYPAVAPVTADGALPWSALAASLSWILDGMAAHSPLPFIPPVTVGWDPRPWMETIDGKLFWYERTPADVAAALDAAITWSDEHPWLRPDDPALPPLVLLEAWNELGEGSYVVPTVGEGRSYGDAIAATLLAPQARARTVLTLNDDGPTAPARQARGTLSDAAGHPIGGATVTVGATATSGPGLYARYEVSGRVPPSGKTAIVGFRVNADGIGPAASDFALYQVSYTENGGPERVLNGDFSSGSAGWGLQGQAQLVASDRGAGSMVRVLATATESARLDSASFTVTPGATFRATFWARIAPASIGSGIFDLVFIDAPNGYLSTPLRAAKATIGTATTTAAGGFALSLLPVASSAVVLEATWPGDAAHFPGYGRTSP